MSDHVGLVLVSHSAAIAAGLAELVGQVAGEGVPIKTAGGGPGGTLGTDGGLVLEALRSIDGAGAVVLVDLGSSVL
jgi:PTS hybrid protein